MRHDLGSRRDDELLALIQAREKDPEIAESAWIELYTRHVRFIYSQVKRAGTLVGRGLDIEDVVERTFQRVWFGAAAQFQPGRYKDSDSARKHVLAWLGKIATNEFRQAIMSRTAEYNSASDPAILETLQSTRQRGGPADPPSDAIRIKIIAQEVLSGDELEIVWLKMQYYDPESGESRVPPDDLEAICARQNITKELFRKRYERALAKIEGASSGVGAALESD